MLSYTQTHKYTERAQIHDCLVQARRFNLDWILLSDVDEYLTVLDTNTTLPQMLQPHQTDDTVGGVSATNVLFGASPAQQHDPNHSWDYRRPRLLIRDFQHRRAEPSRPDHRSKVLVRPHQVQYMHVHKIIVGNATIHKDPFTELRLSHYRKDGACVWPVQDTFLADRYASPLEERLAQVYHPPETAQFYPTSFIENCPG